MIGCQIVILTIVKSYILDRVTTVNALMNYLVNTFSKILWIGIILAIFLAVLNYMFYNKKKEENDETVLTKLS